ncbi:Enhanced intracellular survival protein [Nocardia africana]|uniref:Enhanced intracellular survival protein n=1 Tax=Nocardia africana TaxID=134964 RepID=A0A378WMM9_9NOCA|nr:Enhanced intracellular survival protein [Nocardia africana]
MAIESEVTLRPATEEDLPGIGLLLSNAFGASPREDPVVSAQRLKLFPIERALVAVAGGRVVGHTRDTTMTLTVPGPHPVEVCGVAGVAVAPTHRRRGILRAMYTELHERTEAAGLPLTIFTASSATIYGRFGYGPCVVENRVTIDRRFAEFRPTAPDPGGVTLSSLDDAITVAPDIYDRWRRLVPGAQARPHSAWLIQLVGSGGQAALFALTHPDGYALYRYDTSAPRTLTAEVVELRAVTAEAHAALWRALLGLDLVDTVTATIGDDDPLPHLLTDSRLVRTVSRHDGLWARPMDVPAALSARDYETDLDVVVAVDDPFRHAGGTFALRVRDGRAECEPTTRAPDLELGIDVLGSLYLAPTPPAPSPSRTGCGRRTPGSSRMWTALSGPNANRSSAGSSELPPTAAARQRHRLGPGRPSRPSTLPDSAAGRSRRSRADRRSARAGAGQHARSQGKCRHLWWVRHRPGMLDT